MRLIEFEAKQLLKTAGLSVPRGRLYVEGAALEKPDGPVAIKAQTLTGGRGKGGLVRLASADQAAATAREIRAAMTSAGAAPILLVEQRVSIARECYAAWRIDDLRQTPVLMFSLQGGVEVEGNAEHLREFVCDPMRAPRAQDFVPFFRSLGVEGRAVGTLSRFVTTAYRVFVQNDADLLEINPLVITPKGDVLALDAKVSLDDNASPRHRDWSELISQDLQARELSALERRAADMGVTFVELTGRVAVFSGGAGLGMALLDLLGDSGLGAANFSDLTGGAATDAFQRLGSVVFERAAHPEVDSILIFLTLSATSLKSAVESLLDFLRHDPPPKPLVVGLVAAGAAEREMTVAQAQDAFALVGVICVSDLDDAVRALLEISEKRKASEPA